MIASFWGGPSGAVNLKLQNPKPIDELMQSERGAVKKSEP